MEPQSGKVKAWVGDLNYKYFQYDQVEAPRQVGSVFKPVVYSAAIHQGTRLDAYYKNEQKTYPEYDDWSPRNSDNNYEGYYTLKGALSKSINTIAVELLQTGIDPVIDHARRLGITSELPPYPSLALGVADIPLQEMVRPFMTFANNGNLRPIYYLEEIKDRQGNLIFKAQPEIPRQVLPENEAHLMSNMLSAVIDEGTGQRLRSVYGLHNEMAGKTGTTQNQVDGWFIGYNPQIVVGIRVGQRCKHPFQHHPFRTRRQYGYAYFRPVYERLPGEPELSGLEQTLLPFCLTISAKRNGNTDLQRTFEPARKDLEP